MGSGTPGLCLGIGLMSQLRWGRKMVVEKPESNSQIDVMARDGNERNRSYKLQTDDRKENRISCFCSGGQ